MLEYDGHDVGVFTRLLNSFYRHRWLFLLAVCAVTGVTTGVMKMRKETYKATAQTQVVSDKKLLDATLGEGKGGYALISSAQENVNQFEDMLGDDRRDGFLDSALRAAHLDKPIDVDPRADDPRFLLLRKHLSVNADSDALFSITLVWDSPQEAERIVQALQQQYIEETGQNRQATSIATTKFLDDVMSRYEKLMKTAEQALIDYKKENAGNLPDAMANDVQQLAQLKVERDTLLVSSQDSTLKRQALEARIAEIKPLSILSKTMSESADSLALRDLQVKRNLLIADKLMPTSDKVLFVDKQIVDLQAKIKADAKSGQPAGTVVSKTDLHDNPEYMALDRDLTLARIAEKTQMAQVALVNSQIAVYESRAARIPEEQKILNDRTRGYVFYKTQYDNTVERREKAILEANLDKITARSTLLPVGTIYAESSTSKSKRIIMFVASVIGGLLVGVIVVIYSEWSDQTVRYGADVERLLGLPLLAEVPDLGLAAPQPSTMRQRGRP